MPVEIIKAKTSLKSWEYNLENINKGPSPVARLHRNPLLHILWYFIPSPVMQKDIGDSNGAHHKELHLPWSGS